MGNLLNGYTLLARIRHDMGQEATIELSREIIEELSKRQNLRAGSEEQMHMVRHERPGIAGGLGFRHQPRQPRQKLLAVGVIPEDVPPLDPADHDVLQDPGRVQPSCSWHGPVNTPFSRDRQLNYLRASRINYSPTKTAGKVPLLRRGSTVSLDRRKVSQPAASTAHRRRLKKRARHNAFFESRMDKWTSTESRAPLRL